MWGNRRIFAGRDFSRAVGPLFPRGFSRWPFEATIAAQALIASPVSFVASSAESGQAGSLSYESFSNLLMLPPRMAARSASLRPGNAITLSTGVVDQGNG